jgi:hypothetical protein
MKNQGHKSLDTTVLRDTTRCIFAKKKNIMLVLDIYRLYSKACYCVEYAVSILLNKKNLLCRGREQFGFQIEDNLVL